MTPGEMATEMFRLSALLDSSLDLLNEQAREYASSEDAYRLARARAYIASSGTVDERKSQADLQTSQERQAAHLADGLRQAALEAVRSRRAQISALQSLMAAHRAEAEFVRSAPHEAVSR